MSWRKASAGAEFAEGIVEVEVVDVVSDAPREAEWTVVLDEVAVEHAYDDVEEAAAAAVAGAVES